LDVPAGVAFAMTKVGMAATPVLVVSMTVPQIPGGAWVPELLPPDVTVTRLAGGLVADVGIGPTVLTLQQVTLARGTQLTLGRAEGPILVAVGAGRLSVVDTKSAWIWSGVDRVNRGGHVASLAPGDGVLQSGDGTMVLQNVGYDPVVALIVTLRRAQGSALQAAANGA
jgi:hypothetical protein